MKKFIIYMLAALMLLPVCALGAYRAETEDNEFVSDEKFFEPSSTWKNISAKQINLTKGVMTFYIDEPAKSERIEAEVMPVNTTDKTITFTSEDTSIASVDQSGTVTPTGKTGITRIDIRCGKAMAKVKIQVVKGVTGVELSQTSLTLYADKPVTTQLTASVKPDDATIKDVIWYSEDESIAAVDSEGLVSPCGVGDTHIFARTVDGGFLGVCTVKVTTWEKRAQEIPVMYMDYDITLDEMLEAQMSASPTIFTNSVFPADSDTVEQYLNPENLTSGYDKYQFINLGQSNGVTSSALDAYLNGKGILSGTGDLFKKAADDNGISEVYLVIHACLESGNGMSALANGIDYDGTVVYNLFGIGAVDEAPVEEGARYAYEQGWTSIEKAIEGGAQWISKNYINNSSYTQNTLYKMRWNPERPATHQYATDAAWASKQAKNMSAMFEAFPTAKYVFEVPVYKGQNKIELK